MTVSPSMFLHLQLNQALIAVMATRVSDWRWPVRRRYRFFGLYLKTTIFGPRYCCSTCAWTVAPASKGVPILADPSPPTMSTRSNVISEPCSIGSFSIDSVSPTATRYCLPPVSMMAYGALPEPEPERARTGIDSCSGSVLDPISVMTIFARSFTSAVYDPESGQRARKTGCVNAPATGEYTIAPIGQTDIERGRFRGYQ